MMFISQHVLDNSAMKPKQRRTEQTFDIFNKFALYKSLDTIIVQALTKILHLQKQKKMCPFQEYLAVLYAEGIIFNHLYI